MAEDILSQDEIDTLLTGVDDGEVKTETDVAPERGVVTAYDFSSQEHTIQDSMPALDMVNERFSRNFRASLLNLLRCASTISYDTIKIVQFDEYIRNLFMPSCLNLVKIKPLRGTTLFAIDPKLVYSIIDIFFGGDGCLPTRIEGHDFTGTGIKVIKNILDKVFVDFKKAWSPLFDIELEYIGSEINPYFAQIVDTDELVVISKIHIELSNSVGDLDIVIPYSMLEPCKKQLNTEIKNDPTDFDKIWSDSLKDGIKRASVTIASTLTRVQLTLRELRKLKPGDIIPIELPRTVDANVNGIPILRAHYGISHGNYALQIIERI